jgi:hypothetical protein
MYTAENYLWGWIAYTSGALCLIGLSWLLIRKISLAWVRPILLLLLLVVFFTPVTSHPDNPYLAPAFFVSFYEGLLVRSPEAGFQRGLAPILAIGFSTLFIYTIGRLVLGWVLRLFSPRVTSAASEPEENH